MTKKLLLLVLMVFAGVALGAQTANESANSDQQSKNAQGDVSVTGCVAKQNGDYILVQADQGNSYELERSGKLRLGHYLGQEVEVTGTKHPSLATSSDFLARTGPASPVTIRVKTIKTLADRCGGD
jgi:hypothetical protein